MYEEEVSRLQRIIDDSGNIVFSGAQAYPRRVIFRIFGALTGSTCRSISTPRNRSLATVSL